MGKIADMFVELGLKKDKFDKGMKDAEGAPNKLNSMYAKLGVGIAAAFSVQAVLSFSKAAMAAYDVQAKAEAGLLNALNGRVTVQKRLLDQANTMQQTTLFGDEEIVAAQKQLAVMKLTEAQITKLLPLIADFATSTGMDLSQAAMLVAKAVGTGTNALGRYGVELDSTMSKTEKANAIAEVFAERYGGQAATAAESGAAGVQQFSKAIGELTESVGKLITTNTSGFFEQFSKYLFGLNDLINSDVIPTWRKWLAFLDPTQRQLVAVGKAMAMEDQQQKLKDAQENLNYLRQNAAKLIEQKREEIRQENEELKKGTKELEKQRDIWQDLIGQMRGHDYSTLGMKPKGLPQAESLAGLQGFTGEEFSPPDFTGYYESLEEAAARTMQFKDEMSAIFQQFMTDFVSTFAQGIANLITGDSGFDDFFKSILNTFGSFLKQMGEAQIAYGLSMIALESTFSNPYAAIAAGAALVAIGAVISNLASQGPDLSGNGAMNTAGMSGSGNYGGFNSGGLYDRNGELVLTTEVSGDNLLFILQRAENNRLRTRG